MSPSERPPLPLPRDLWLVWLLREDIRGAGSAWDAERGRKFLLWWILHGRHQYPGAAPLPAQEIEAVFRPVAIHAGARRVEVPWLAAELWAASGEPDVARLRQWFDRHLVPQCRLSDLLPGTPARQRIAERATPRFGPPQRRDGVNLIGFARGQFGLGEDTRMAAAALEAAGVPFTVLGLQEHSDWRHHDRALDAYLGADLPFAINLLCVTGFETAERRLRLGREFWQGRHTIGWWPWELPRWPAAWRPACELVDEIWAATRYAQAAYAADCPVPVTLMPPAVAVDRLRPRSRASLGLPEEAFLFVLAFDGNSSLARKNPQAVAAAFREAFPEEDEPVGLVLKGMNGQGEPGWTELARACAADPRILLIDEIWPREDVLALLAACDAVVSLHRAEGFGRLLAEAMLLEKPVIATDFSGNTDFLSAETGFPIRCWPRRVRRGEYPFGEGQSWAEPDVAAAAAAMRRIAADPALARPVARAGRALVRAHFSPAAAGERMRRRLREVGLEAAGR